MLAQYQQRARLLVGDPTFARFNDADLRDFTNTARGQIAGEGECVRVYGSLAVTSGNQQYQFSAITFPDGTKGVQGVLNVRAATYALGDGQQRITPREWEFFQTYYLADPAPVSGQPEVWAQFGQGASGTLFVNLPDSDYTLSLDTVCFPDALGNDTDIEALPYLWTDAVPYFTAYLALLTVQEDQRAEVMLKLYQNFVSRARTFATPSVLPHQFSQGPDPQMANRLGIQMRAGQ